MTAEQFNKVLSAENNSSHVQALKKLGEEQSKLTSMKKARSVAYKAATVEIKTQAELIASLFVKLNVGDKVLIRSGKQDGQSGTIVFVGPRKVSVTGMDKKSKPFMVHVGHGDIDRLESAAAQVSSEERVEAQLIESIEHALANATPEDGADHALLKALSKPISSSKKNRK